MKNRMLTLIALSLCLCSTSQATSSKDEDKSPINQPVEFQRDGHLVKGSIGLKGFPKNVDITFYIGREKGKESKQGGTFQVLDDDNIRFTNQEKKPECNIVIDDILPGSTIWLVFKTKKEEILRSEISFPLVNACSDKEVGILANLIEIRPTVYQIKVEGLKEGEKITIESSSGDELIEHTFTYSKGFSFTLAPGVIGKSGGKSSLKISTNNRTSTIMLPWGVYLMKYVQTILINLDPRVAAQFDKSKNKPV